MKVTLLKDVEGLGKKDENVTVCKWCAENYLFKNNLASISTDTSDKSPKKITEIIFNYTGYLGILVILISPMIETSYSEHPIFYILCFIISTLYAFIMVHHLPFTNKVVRDLVNENRKVLFAIKLASSLFIFVITFTLYSFTNLFPIATVYIIVIICILIYTLFFIKKLFN